MTSSTSSILATRIALAMRCTVFGEHSLHIAEIITLEEHEKSADIGVRLDEASSSTGQPRAVHDIIHIQSFRALS